MIRWRPKRARSKPAPALTSRSDGILDGTRGSPVESRWLPEAACLFRMAVLLWSLNPWVSCHVKNCRMQGFDWDAAYMKLGGEGMAVPGDAGERTPCQRLISALGEVWRRSFETTGCIIKTWLREEFRPLGAASWMSAAS